MEQHFWMDERSFVVFRVRGLKTKLNLCHTTIQFTTHHLFFINKGKKSYVDPMYSSGSVYYSNWLRSFYLRKPKRLSHRLAAFLQEKHVATVACTVSLTFQTSLILSMHVAAVERKALPLIWKNFQQNQNLSQSEWTGDWSMMAQASWYKDVSQTVGSIYHEIRISTCQWPQTHQ